MLCFVKGLAIRPTFARSTPSEPGIYEAHPISVKLSGQK